MISKIEHINGYRTSDGQIFSTLPEAQTNQTELDIILTAKRVFNMDTYDGTTEEEVLEFLKVGRSCI